MNAHPSEARLTAVFESLKQIQQLITRLSKLPTQPGSSSADSDEWDARIELGAEIHQRLKEQEEDFGLLRQEIEDRTTTSTWSSAGRPRNGERERADADLATQVTRLGEDLKTARTQFRKAQLQAKRNAEAAKRKQRELLFAGLKEGDSSASHGRRKGQEKLSQDDLVLSASSDVTTALRRTHNLMTAELERSRFAQETLENSTKDLANLSESYTNLDTLLSSSRSLVSTLIYSQKSDTWYLETAVYILIATIGWLIFRRLIYGPGWWLVYFPLRQFWRISLYIVQSFIGTLSAAAGIAGAQNQSVALSQSSASISASSRLAQKATGTGKIPRFPSDHVAPSIKAGGGGHGAKMQQPGQPVREGEKSLSEKVGQMAEESQKLAEKAEPEAQGTTLRERTAEDGPPNPKKRMWEEPIERSKDEL